MTGLKYGKLDPKRAESLKFAKYKQSAAIASFPKVNYLSSVDWSATMNGNDEEGDCVPCGAVNLVLLFSTIFTGTGIRASLAEVIAIYKTQNPNFDPNGTADTNGPGSSADGGMDEQTMLEAWVKDGFTIGGQLIKAVAFASVDHTDLAEIKEAISIAGGVMFGVQVAAVQQTQFPGVWDYDPNSPIEGGHCIIGGGHEDVATDDVQGECWAADFGITDAFMAHQSDECWLVLFEWHLGTKRLIDGMDMATFASDFTALTGDPFPVAVNPTPAPVTPPDPPVTPPAPSPVPGDVDATYFAANHAWALKRHTTGNEVAAENFLKWATEKGFNISEHQAEHSAP